VGICKKSLAAPFFFFIKVWIIFWGLIRFWWCFAKFDVLWPCSLERGHMQKVFGSSFFVLRFELYFED
jgi:hypothetical protein